MPANEIQKFDTILGKLEIVEEDGKELADIIREIDYLIQEAAEQ